jgi:transketolase
VTELQYVPVPEFNRALNATRDPLARTRLFATLARLNVLYMISAAGSGHIGTSFSCLDVVSWLYLNEMAPEDVYFSSKGHDVPALYAVLIALGRLDPELIHRLRRLDGLPGHPDVGTPGIVTNTGSLGMGVSKAKGMVEANRLLAQRQRIFVLTGDGELQEGQFWESLSTAVTRRMGEITLIVDHNKIQSDTWVRDVSDLGDLEAKLSAFGWQVARCDGHDVEALRAVFDGFRSITDRPKALIANTLKGAGVQGFVAPAAMAPDGWRYKFHSGAPPVVTTWQGYERAAEELIARANQLLLESDQPALDLESRPAPFRRNPENVQRLVPAYARGLIEWAGRDERIVALDADLILDTGLIPFREAYPSRFIECGIAEQDMVSQAGGMALKGMLPFVHSFACFLHARPNEQIYNNASERTKVIYVGSLAGLLPAAAGHSHQAVRDISALAAVPGLVLLEPCCEREVEEAVRFCVEGTSESVYLRLVSLPWLVDAELPADYRLRLGRGTVLRDGGDAVIFGYGPILLGEALTAAAKLASEDHVNVRVVDLPWLNRLDEEWFADTVRGIACVFALDNQYVSGGQGVMLGAALARLHLDDAPSFHQLGLDRLPASGQPDEVLRAHGLDAESLCQAVRARIGARQAV